MHLSRSKKLRTAKKEVERCIDLYFSPKVMRLEDDRKTAAMLTGQKYRYEATKASLAIVMILATLLLISSCQAGSLSPRTALEAPLELSNNTELKAKFVSRIDGEFWIEIRYTREFHFSREHPAPLTEFSASYIIKQDGNIVQKGGFGLAAPRCHA
jgi:hypothetical protein